MLHDPTSFAVLVILPGILASLIVRYGLGIYMGLAKLRGDFLFLGAKVAAGVFVLWWVGLILYGIVLYWKGGPTFRGKIILTPDGFYKLGAGRKSKSQFARWHSTSRVEIRKGDLYLYSKFGGAIFLPKEGIEDEVTAEAVREATAQLWESNGSGLPNVLNVLTPSASPATA